MEHANLFLGSGPENSKRNVFSPGQVLRAQHALAYTRGEAVIHLGRVMHGVLPIEVGTAARAAAAPLPRCCIAA
jgi:hypothetical protein